MNNNRKTALAVALTFLLTTILYTAAYTVIPSFSGTLGKIRTALDGGEGAKVGSKIREIDSYIDKSFIYGADKEKMADEALYGYVAGLGDVYSEYISKDDYEQMMEELTGDYMGIGVEVYIDADKLITVLTVFEEGPAAKAGVKSGDKIVEVNGTKVSYSNYDEALDIMKGTGSHKGESDELKITLRRGEEEIKTNLKRKEVKNNTVSSKMLDEKIGYVRISQFDEATGTDFEIHTSRLLSDGAKALIVDLRNNPGGTLTGVVSVADRLLPKGKIITIKDKSGRETVYNSDDYEIELPMAVLINGSSASASEVLAGALRDHKKAKLVGEKTFGKGIVQTIFNLRDDSALKLTTSEYFTPNGESIHKKGISPDYEVKLDSNVNIFTLAESEDAQLQKAIEILK